MDHDHRSSFNNGVFEVDSVSQFGEYITIMPSQTLVEEVQGADVLIRLIATRLALISVSMVTPFEPHTLQPGVISFFSNQDLFAVSPVRLAQGNDLEFSLNEVRSHFGLTTGVVVDDISF